VRVDGPCGDCRGLGWRGEEECEVCLATGRGTYWVCMDNIGGRTCGEPLRMVARAGFPAGVAYVGHEVRYGCERGHTHRRIAGSETWGATGSGSVEALRTAVAS